MGSGRAFCGAAMAWRLEVCLLSSRSVCVELAASCSVHDLQLEAQRQLEVGALRLLLEGEELCAEDSLVSAGLADGVRVTALVAQVRLCGHLRGTTLSGFLEGGPVTTWGNFVDGAQPAPEGLSVVAMRATARGYGAILTDGRVACWGDVEGDWAQLRHVKALQVTNTAFAALMEARKVL